MKEFCQLLGIKQNLSTAYHPQTDCQTEWTNQEVKTYLRIYTSYLQDDWANKLCEAEFAINNRQSSTIKQSSFFLMYGQHPYTEKELQMDYRSTDVHDYLTKMMTLDKRYPIN